jgi:hypothetical protein
MSFWQWLFGGNNKPPPTRYGLSLDNPVLCGGGPLGERDYLERLRCPSGASVRSSKVARLKTQQHDHIDICLIECDCGNHRFEVYLDPNHGGPARPIGEDGWRLEPETSLATSRQQRPACPYCGEPLRAEQAKQCFQCGMDWHNPENVVCRKRT